MKLATLRFACSLVRFALSETKQRQDVKRGLVYKTVGAIGFQLLQTLQAHYKNALELAPREAQETWKPDAPDKSAKQQVAPAGIRLREMTGDGQFAKLEDKLFQKGFQIGDHVMDKTTHDLWVIAECKGSKVVLQGYPDKEQTEDMFLPDFLAQYTRPSAGFESKVLVEDKIWQRVDPRFCRAGAIAVAKAEVMRALEIASGLHPDASQAVQPMLNLRGALAGVVASKNAKAGSIVLVPWTTHVSVDFPDDFAFKRHQPWTVELTSGSPLIRFVGEEKVLPRVSLLPWSTHDKPDARQEPKSQEQEGKNTEAEAAKGKQEGKKNEPQGKRKQAQQEEQEEDNKKVNRMAVFWRIQAFTPRDKKWEEFNMEIGHITVDTWGQIVSQSKNIGAKHASKPDFAQSACLTKVIIPVLVNKKDVARGDALIYVKQDVPKPVDRTSKPLSQRPLLEKMLAGAAASEPAAKRTKFA